MIGNRRYPRYPVNLRVRLQLPSGELETTTEEISLAGFSAQCASLPETGTKFDFVMHLPDGSLVNGIAAAVVCGGAFALLAVGRWDGFAAILLVALLVRIAGGSVFAVTPAYLCERFPPATRGTGFGLGYSTPLLITSFYAYYQNWLGHLIPIAYTPVVLLVVGGALITCGVLLGPESRDADLAAPVPQPTPLPTVAVPGEATA